MVTTTSSTTEQIVDKALGSSYQVVKEVYKNLDAIKALNENENIETLLSNYDEIKQVLDEAPSLVQVASKLDEITAAPDYADKASAYCQQAQQLLSQTQEQKEAVASLLSQTQEAVASIEDASDNVATLLANMVAVKIVRENITKVKSLAASLEDESTIQKVDDLLENLSVVETVSENLDYIKEVSSAVLNRDNINKITAALNQINNVNTVATNTLSSLETSLEKMQTQTATFQQLATTSQVTLEDTAAESISDLENIKTECEALLEEVKTYKDAASAIREDCNKILLKVRDLYHHFEDTLGKAVKKAMLAIMHEGDSQVKRIRDLADTTADRLDDLSKTIVETTTERMQEAAQAVADEALAELETKIAEAQENFEKIVEEVTATLEQAKVDFDELLQEIEDKINAAGDDKLQEIANYIVDMQYGDIRWGYVDYSLAENQEEMVVGVTYINAWDDDGYIQISLDSNAFEREPEYIRFYIKSQSNTVTYLTKKVKFNIDEVLAASTTAKGIIEIATIQEIVEGTDYELAVTAGALAEALPDILESLLEAKENGNTNTLVQTIVNTIASDVHLQEIIYDSLASLIESAIADSVTETVQATTEQKGVVELATTEETKAGTDTERAVTPSGLINALPSVLQSIFTANSDGITNTVAQVIIQAIAGNTQLQEDLASAVQDNLELDAYARLAGADFTGTVTVPSQTEQDSSSWDENVVLNKSDILSLIEAKKSTYVEVLNDAPSTEAEVPDEDVFYAYPVEVSDYVFGEITNINVMEDETLNDYTAGNLSTGTMNIYNAGDLL